MHSVLWSTSPSAQVWINKGQTPYRCLAYLPAQVQKDTSTITSILLGTMCIDSIIFRAAASYVSVWNGSYLCTHLQWSASASLHSDSQMQNMDIFPSQWAELQAHIWLPKISYTACNYSDSAYSVGCWAAHLLKSNTEAYRTYKTHNTSTKDWHIQVGFTAIWLVQVQC